MIPDGHAGIEISIHALREEGDRRSRPRRPDRSHFNPRPPRGGRHTLKANGSRNYGISIHALREEGDALIRIFITFFFVISIHALREEGDWSSKAGARGQILFQSTPSARRATGRPSGGIHAGSDFNPRPPRGGRPFGLMDVFKEHWKDFNPRPPRGERPARAQNLVDDGKFQSTPSARRATINGWNEQVKQWISIHALREESDVRRVIGVLVAVKFQSTPSARRATASETTGRAASAFQSTPSARRATATKGERIKAIGFQSTPSARRATSPASSALGLRRNFNPRPPRGERQQKQRKNPMLLFHYTHLCTI